MIFEVWIDDIGFMALGGDAEDMDPDDMKSIIQEALDNGGLEGYYEVELKERTD